MRRDRNTSYAQRVAIVEQHLAGSSYHGLAKEMGLNYYTVRHWCRQYRDYGWEGLKPKPARQGATPLKQFHPLVRYVALKLKRQHPGWGADKLLLEMRRRPALQGLALPKRSSLYRYYQPFAPRLLRHRPARTQRPPLTLARARAVHQVWQMDFKGEVKLGQVGLVKPLNVCDEYSSASLATLIHSGQRGAITMRQVQHDLRQVFSQWGLPQALRMDRDPLWVGSTRLEFPSQLLLWLVGLGVQVLINRPHRPTDNAQVERCNGIWFEQVGRGQQYDSYPQVQAASDQARQDRLSQLPSANVACRMQAPLVALPQLLGNQRPYSPPHEAELFDMQRVWHYLTHWRWQRTVDSTGQLSLGGYNRRLGSAYAGQVMQVHFDLEQGDFVAVDVLGQEVKRFLLPSITADFILGTGCSLLDSA